MRLASLLMVVLLVAVPVAGAQPRVARVGMLANGSPGASPAVDAFRHGLRDLGYVEGQNLALEIRWAEGRFERLPEFAAELVRSKPDVLVTAGPYGIEAARRVTAAIPIVMITCDPAEGVVERLARPSGHSALSGAVRERADALFVLPDPLTLNERRRIAELAARHRLPAMYGFKEFVHAGGLMSYGTMQTDLYRRAAAHVDKVLKGAKPADVPVEQATRFELVINLRTAKALGLTLPQSMLIRADQVID